MNWDQILKRLIVPVTAGVLAPVNPAPEVSMTSVEDGPQDILPGMLAGVYCSTVDSKLRPANSQYIFYLDGFL